MWKRTGWAITSATTVTSARCSSTIRNGGSADLYRMYWGRLWRPGGAGFLNWRAWLPVSRVKILITGICGFVGSRLARALQERLTDVEITGIDNLLRPGSETN